MLHLHQALSVGKTKSSPQVLLLPSSFSFKLGKCVILTSHRYHNNTDILRQISKISSPQIMFV